MTLRHFDEHEHVQQHGERGALYGFMLENVDHDSGEIHGSNVTNVKVGSALQRWTCVVLNATLGAERLGFKIFKQSQLAAFHTFTTLSFPSLQVEGRFPAGATIDEKYFYLEAHDGAEEQSDTHSNEDSVKECTVRYEDSQPVVTCEIPFVLAQVGIYVHASYREDKFSDADLARMEKERHQFAGKLYHKGSLITEEHADVFHHWENPKQDAARDEV